MAEPLPIVAHEEDAVGLDENGNIQWTTDMDISEASHISRGAFDDSYAADASENQIILFDDVSRLAVLSFDTVANVEIINGQGVAQDTGENEIIFIEDSSREDELSTVNSNDANFIALDLDLSLDGQRTVGYAHLGNIYKFEYDFGQAFEEWEISPPTNDVPTGGDYAADSLYIVSTFSNQIARIDGDSGDVEWTETVTGVDSVAAHPQGEGVYVCDGNGVSLYDTSGNEVEEVISDSGTDIKVDTQRQLYMLQNGGETLVSYDNEYNERWTYSDDDDRDIDEYNIYPGTFADVTEESTATITSATSNTLEAFNEFNFENVNAVITSASASPTVVNGIEATTGTSTITSAIGTPIIASTPGLSLGEVWIGQKYDSEDDNDALVGGVDDYRLVLGEVLEQGDIQEFTHQEIPVEEMIRETSTTNYQALRDYYKFDDRSTPFTAINSSIYGERTANVNTDYDNLLGTAQEVQYSLGPGSGMSIDFSLAGRIDVEITNLLRELESTKRGL